MQPEIWSAEFNDFISKWVTSNRVFLKKKKNQRDNHPNFEMFFLQQFRGASESPPYLLSIE